MAIYNIKYAEINTAYFGVEASNEYEALERFEEWRLANDHIYDTMYGCCNYDSQADIVYYDVRLHQEDILTEEKYRAL